MHGLVSQTVHGRRPFFHLVLTMSAGAMFGHVANCSLRVDSEFNHPSLPSTILLHILLHKKPITVADFASSTCSAPETQWSRRQRHPRSVVLEPMSGLLTLGACPRFPPLPGVCIQRHCRDSHHIAMPSRASSRRWHCLASHGAPQIWPSVLCCLIFCLCIQPHLDCRFFNVEYFFDDVCDSQSTLCPKQRR